MDAGPNVATMRVFLLLFLSTIVGFMRSLKVMDDIMALNRLRI